MMKTADGKVDLSLLQADIQVVCSLVRGCCCPKTDALCIQGTDTFLTRAILMFIQADPQGVYWGLRFSAYFPCVIREGRYVVIEATVFQPEPRSQPAYVLREVTSTSTRSTEGIGWGADVGISQRTHWAGGNCLETRNFESCISSQHTPLLQPHSHGNQQWLHSTLLWMPATPPTSGQ